MRPFIYQLVSQHRAHPSHSTQCIPSRVLIGIFERMKGLGGILVSLHLTVASCIPVTPNQSLASTISAASCSRNDVETAVIKAVNGDTVIIPAGSCTWTSNLAIDRKFLTLKGAGTGRTTITDGVSKGGYPNLPQVLAWNTIDGGLSRLTGITFKGGIIPDTNNKGIVQLTGSSHSFRIDHCEFIPTQTAGLFIRGDLWGVIDHNLFDLSARHGYGIYAMGHSYGDPAWAEDSMLGTEQHIFVEDNTFNTDDSTGNGYPAIDGWSGSRVVIRNNRFNATRIHNHGTESPGRSRSQRSWEIYRNTFTWNMQGQGYPSLIMIRGGTGVIFDNAGTTSNGAPKYFITYSYFRAEKSYSPWDKCASSWDQSAERCIDQTGLGKGALLSGDSPQPRWLGQVSEPAYDWDNLLNGSPSPAASSMPNIIRENRDFIHARKPGYTPYRYPHPLSALSEKAEPGPDSPKDLLIK